MVKHKSQASNNFYGNPLLEQKRTQNHMSVDHLVQNQKQFTQLNSKSSASNHQALPANLLSQPSDISISNADRLPIIPHKMKDIQITQLPNQDEVSFAEIPSLADGIFEKYAEFMNNDNDIYYLESSFPDIYRPVIEETLTKESIQIPPASQEQIFKQTNTTNLTHLTGMSQSKANKLSGLLSICFEDTHSKGQINLQTHLKYIHPQYKLTIQNMNNNPMINNTQSINADNGFFQFNAHQPNSANNLSTNNPPLST